MMICRNCAKKLTHPESNFCSQECFDEWMGKEMANAIAIICYGMWISLQKKEDSMSG